MKPRKKEDKSKLLMAPMPGLLVSVLVKENDGKYPIQYMEKSLTNILNEYGITLYYKE